MALPITGGAIACAALISDQPALCAGMAAASTLSGLSANWFFIGAGDVRALLLFDTAPRAVSNIAGSVAVAAGASVLTLPAMLGVAILCASTWSSVLILKTASVGQRPVRRSDVIAALTRQFPPLASSLLASSYLTVPLISVAILAPSATPAYAMADRLLKLALTALSPIAQYAQSWVPAPGADLRQRIARALSLVSVVAVSSGLAFSLGAPMVGHWLSAGELTVSYSVSSALGVALAASVLTQTLGLACLVPLGRQRALLLATAVGAPLSLLVQWGLISTLGALAAAFSVGLSEVAVLVVEFVALRRTLHAFVGTSVGGDGIRTVDLH
jgi:hypothetical protein